MNKIKFTKDDLSALFGLLLKLEGHMEERKMEYGVITGFIQDLNDLGFAGE